MKGEPWSGELEMVTKSGHVLPAYARADAIKNSEGNIVGLIGVITDITEREKAENALIRSEKELKNSQQITHIGSWYLDVATNQVVWTEELYKMYEFDPTLPPPSYTEHQKCN